MTEAHACLNLKNISLEQTESQQNSGTSRMKELSSELVQEEELEVTDGGESKLAPIEVKTGEEDEDVIYREKAKICRLDEGENQWKERGRGEARILRDKSDHSKFRFILRRDGTGKLGSNHYLCKSMKIHLANKKCCIWHCPADTSDEEIQPEKFLLSFATPELANEFIKVFDGCVSHCEH